MLNAKRRLCAAVAWQGGGVILVIDNQTDVTEPQFKFVEKMGYRVQFVESGPEAMGFINMVRPGLIILDMMAPNLFGLHLLRNIKGSPQLSDIPTMICTCATDPRLRETSLALGACDFLLKTDASPTGLLERINQFYRETSPPVPDPADHQSDAPPILKISPGYQPWTHSQNRRIKWVLAESQARILRSSALLGLSRKFIPANKMDRLLSCRSDGEALPNFLGGARFPQERKERKNASTSFRMYS